jgi:hypothetical protein
MKIGHKTEYNVSSIKTIAEGNDAKQSPLMHEIRQQFCQWLPVERSTELAIWRCLLQDFI